MKLEDIKYLTRIGLVEVTNSRLEKHLRKMLNRSVAAKVFIFA